MSESIKCNLYHFDHNFKIKRLNDGTVRVIKQTYLDLPEESIEVRSLDKEGKPSTGNVELIIPSWIYLENQDFFDKQ